MLYISIGGRQLQTIPIVGQEKSSMDLSSFKSNPVQVEQVSYAFLFHFRLSFFFWLHSGR